MSFSSESPKLTVVMFHYIRDYSRTPFPRIKGMAIEDFTLLLRKLKDIYEMASLEAALSFISGDYSPSRDLCLLTFDDGLKDHYHITPLLAENKVAGLFFVTTKCIEQGHVASVHKNHFLMAKLDFPDYKKSFIDRLMSLNRELDMTVSSEEARKTYRWDSPEVAEFKYFLNFRVPSDLCRRVIDELFEAVFGPEEDFARDLYLSWDEVRAMQEEGMVIGGHTHNHLALSSLDYAVQEKDLRTCHDLLKSRLSPQALWPFSYAYGKRNSFNSDSVRILKDIGFCCSFATEVGINSVNTDRFCIGRIDPKDVDL